MKKITLIISVFCFFPLRAQHKIMQNIEKLKEQHVLFKPVAPLIKSDNKNNTAFGMVSDATFARLDAGLVKNIFLNKDEYLELTVPYENAWIDVQLYRVNLTSQDFEINTNKTQNISFIPGAYYRGMIKGNPKSIVAFSFFENEMYGIISGNEIGNVVVGRLNTLGNSTDYIIYSDAKLMVPQSFECTTADEKTVRNNIPEKNNMDVQSEHCVTIYFELRYNAFLANGSDVTQTANWFTALFNNVQTLFDNDGITTAIKSIYIWTEADPYDLAAPSAYDLLDQFAVYTPIFDADAGLLISANPGNGLAYGIGALCSDLNRSYAKISTTYQQVPAYSASVKIIAHELGHTFGSQHTHGCYWNGNNTAIDGCSTGEGDCSPGPVPSDEEGGTIMSYCSNINFANGFGQQPGDRIRQHIASSHCLGTDCISSCTNTISALYLVDTTNSSSTLSWTDTEGSIWQVGIAPLAEKFLTGRMFLITLL